MKLAGLGGMRMEVCLICSRGEEGPLSQDGRAGMMSLWKKPRPEGQVLDRALSLVSEVSH
jgi:hypothetical protein